MNHREKLHLILFLLIKTNIKIGHQLTQHNILKNVVFYEIYNENGNGGNTFVHF